MIYNIVAACNSKAALQQCIERIANQTYVCFQSAQGTGSGHITVEVLQGKQDRGSQDSLRRPDEQG